jgi:hypothetical protein
MVSMEPDKLGGRTYTGCFRACQEIVLLSGSGDRLTGSLYQHSVIMTHRSSHSQADGHDPQGLIDEVVPSVAAVIDDVVEGFEDPVNLFDSQLSRMNCLTFS